MTSPNAKRRILLVDDDASILKLTKQRLEHEGFDVVTAHDGEEALRCVAEDGIDLLLVDMQLPKLDGYEVCRRLKANPATAAIPIIAFSGREAHQRYLANRHHGVLATEWVDWVEKPFESEVLVGAIRRAIEERGR